MDFSSSRHSITIPRLFLISGWSARRKGLVSSSVPSWEGTVAWFCTWTLNVITTFNTNSAWHTGKREFGLWIWNHQTKDADLRAQMVDLIIALLQCSIGGLQPYGKLCIALCIFMPRHDPESRKKVLWGSPHLHPMWRPCAQYFIARIMPLVENIVLQCTSYYTRHALST